MKIIRTASKTLLKECLRAFSKRRRGPNTFKNSSFEEQKAMTTYLQTVDIKEHKTHAATRLQAAPFPTERHESKKRTKDVSAVMVKDEVDKLNPPAEAMQDAHIQQDRRGSGGRYERVRKIRMDKAPKLDNSSSIENFAAIPSVINKWKKVGIVQTCDKRNRI